MSNPYKYFRTNSYCNDDDYDYGVSMNYVKNDLGEMVVAIGAPGSMERVKAEYPQLIKSLDRLYCESVDCPGRAVDIAVGMIREAGIRSEMETNSLLSASLYSNEGGGTVTALVMQAAQSNRALFKDTYCASLKQAVAERPDLYQWHDKSDAEVERVAQRMFIAMESGSFNHDSLAFRKTAKALGIKPTRTAILRFWRGL